jgi:hypothetical protein
MTNEPLIPIVRGYGRQSADKCHTREIVFPFRPKRWYKDGDEAVNALDIVRNLPLLAAPAPLIIERQLILDIDRYCLVSERRDIEAGVRRAKLLCPLPASRTS